MSLYLDPLAYIRRYESGGDYFVLYGGGSCVGLPADEYGFPQWAGKGNSHAAGAYQFQPGTWALYAARLGIADFGPRSQDAVAAACFAVRKFADWAPYNAKLASAIKLAGGEAMFSLGASFLAMQPAPAPDPAPQEGVMLKDGDTIEAQDGDKRFRLTVKVASAMLAAVLAGAAGVQMMPAAPETPVTLRFEYQPTWQKMSWAQIP